MLTIEYANMLSSRVGPHGLDEARIAPGSAAADGIKSITADLAKSNGTGWERWRQLWREPMRSEHVNAIKPLAKDASKYENLVVLGIGGSALGNIALQSALNSATHNLQSHKERNGPRVFVVDNVDPVYLDSILKICDPKKTLFNVVSKSGETAETAAQFMIIRERLQHALGKKWASHVVAITDPEKGTMRTICDEAGITTLPVPEGVGGRFSSLSPVGLFSAAAAGIDIDAMLDGAAAMDDRCMSDDLHQNPAAMLALLLVEMGTTKGKPNHVMMPYCNALYLMADWYRQLWAESLGKKFDNNSEIVFAGFTPIKALGATDQHSQVQLYREGPNDKVFMFLEVEEFDTDITIPTGMGIDAISYLEGQSLATLLSAEKRATEFALLDSVRPNMTIKFPKVDAYHIGEFIAIWQVATAYAGRMLNIDAYDQPAVETGKKATFGLMGREGYSEWLTKVNDALGQTEYTI